MDNPIVAENPILAEVLDDLLVRLDNVDLIQGLLDHVRAEIDENAAHLAEAAAQYEQVRRHATEVYAAPVTVEEQHAVFAALVEAAVGIRAHIKDILEHRRQLGQAVALLVVARAIASARSRAPLLPGVLLAAAAAAVLVYAASWGSVVPGLRSFVRISYLVLCFLLRA